MLYSRVYIPSRTTVSRDVRTLHRDMKLGLMQLLAVRIMFKPWHQTFSF